MDRHTHESHDQASNPARHAFYDAVRSAVIEEEVAALYNPRMPYHNFAHAQTVLDDAGRMLAKCARQGIAVAGDVVYYAALLHDAGYHEDSEASGFASKEAYSAWLAERLLIDHAVPAATITAVKAAIMSTHCDGVCSSAEDKVVRAADLAGLAGDYAMFKDNAKKLKTEHYMLWGKSVSWREWRKQAVDVINLFLREDMALTDDYYNAAGESVFHIKARANLQRLLQDDVE